MYNPVQEMSKIPSGSRVIFYGSGNMGKKCLNEYRQNSDYELISFVDKRHSEIGSLDGVPVKSPQTLSSTNFDYVIPTTTKYFNEVVKDLGNMGIPESKIIM